MSKEKSIHACYEEIKRREVKELEDAVRDNGGGVVFQKDSAPMIVVNFGGFCPHPADVLITRVELCDEEDEDVLRIYGREKCSSACSDWYEDEREINISDIEYGHIEFITSECYSPYKNKKRHGDKNYLIMETAIFMAWNMFEMMYNAENGMGQFEVCSEIIRLAKEFEETRTWNVSDDDYDEGLYFDELDKFEKEYLTKNFSL